MLKVCLNGARSPREHPRLPVTSEELAEQAASAVAAGATAIHLHVKDSHGRDTFAGIPLARAMHAVRAAVPGTPVGVSTGAWALADPQARVANIETWSVLPDFASVNWHEQGAEEVARALLVRGIGVEAGLWTPGDVAAFGRSALRRDCLRVLLELPSAPEHVAVRLADFLLEELADLGVAAPVLLHGEDASAWPVLRHARVRGCDQRIGLEDTLTLPDGSVADDNAALVSAALSRVSGAEG